MKYLLLFHSNIGNQMHLNITFTGHCHTCWYLMSSLFFKYLMENLFISFFVVFDGMLQNTNMAA